MHTCSQTYDTVNVYLLNTTQTPSLPPVVSVYLSNNHSRHVFISAHLTIPDPYHSKHFSIIFPLSPDSTRCFPVCFYVWSSYNYYNRQMSPGVVKNDKLSFHSISTLLFRMLSNCVSLAPVVHSCFQQFLITPKWQNIFWVAMFNAISTLKINLVSFCRFNKTRSISIHLNIACFNLFTFLYI